MWFPDKKNKQFSEERLSPPLQIPSTSGFAPKNFRSFSGTILRTLWWPNEKDEPPHPPDHPLYLNAVTHSSNIFSKFACVYKDADCFLRPPVELCAAPRNSGRSIYIRWLSLNMHNDLPSAALTKACPGLRSCRLRLFLTKVIVIGH